MRGKTHTKPPHSTTSPLERGLSRVRLQVWTKKPGNGVQGRAGTCTEVCGCTSHRANLKSNMLPLGCHTHFTLTPPQCFGQHQAAEQGVSGEASGCQCLARARALEEKARRPQSQGKVLKRGSSHLYTAILVATCHTRGRQEESSPKSKWRDEGTWFHFVSLCG